MNPIDSDEAHGATEALFEFPCFFPIKVMGRTDADFGQSVIEIVSRYAPDFDPQTTEMRASANGTYLSVTCTIVAHSKSQLDLIYQALTNNPLVLMAL